MNWNWIDKRSTQTAEEDVPTEVIEDENNNGQNQFTLGEVSIDEFLVIVYDNKNYIGKVIALDDDDNEIEVTCMEECGKTEGRYRWPRNKDTIWLPRSNILKKIEEPHATGKSQRIFRVDQDTIAFMRA